MWASRCTTRLKVSSTFHSQPGTGTRRLVILMRLLFQHQQNVQERHTNIHGTFTEHSPLIEYSIREDSIEILSESSDSAGVILDHWNTKNIIKHRMMPKLKRSISGALHNYSQAEIATAIDNYAKILHAPKGAYRWSYKWTLADFLSRGIDKFIDWGVCDANYKTDGNGKGGGSARALPTEYPPSPVYNRPMLRE